VTTQNKTPEPESIETQTDETTPSSERLDYETPKMTKKRSVAAVTLFSGGGASAGGLTAAG